MLAALASHFARRKLTLGGAAKKTGIAEERLRAVTEGAEPSLHELRQIADVLKMPLTALLDQEKSSPAQTKMLFRKNARAEENQRSLVEEILSSRINEVISLASDVPSNLRWLEAFKDLDPVPENAEAFANRFRQYFFQQDQLGPIFELPSLVGNSLGVFLILVDSQEIEGASAIIGHHAFVLLSRRTFKPRMLFTLAHEVGHLVAHHSRDSNTEFAHFDKVKSIGTTRRQQKAEERFADTFASSLLMPTDAVLSLLKEVRRQYALSGPLGDIEINLVSRFFGVSFEVAGRRCEDMGLLPSGGAFALYDQIVQDHGNPEKRASEVGLPEREPLYFDTSPVLLRAGIKKIKTGDASIGKVAEALNIPLSTLVAANSEGN